MWQLRTEHCVGQSSWDTAHPWSSQGANLRHCFYLEIVFRALGKEKKSLIFSFFLFNLEKGQGSRGLVVLPCRIFPGGSGKAWLGQKSPSKGEQSRQKEEIWNRKGWECDFPHLEQFRVLKVHICGSASAAGTFSGDWTNVTPNAAAPELTFISKAPKHEMQGYLSLRNGNAETHMLITSLSCWKLPGWSLPTAQQRFLQAKVSAPTETWEFCGVFLCQALAQKDEEFLGTVSTGMVGERWINNSQQDSNYEHIKY